MPIKSFCTKDVVCIGPEASVFDAANLMKERHVGDLVVCKHPDRPKDPIGILTDRDLVLHVIACNLDGKTTKVQDIMFVDPRIICESDGILETTEKMENAGVRRLPVVDASGNLAGIISADDIYDLISTELGNLSRIRSRQAHKEGAGFSRGLAPTRTPRPSDTVYAGE